MNNKKRKLSIIGHIKDTPRALKKMYETEVLELYKYFFKDHTDIKKVAFLMSAMVSL